MVKYIGQHNSIHCETKNIIIINKYKQHTNKCNFTEQKDKFEDKLEKILETIPEYIISPRVQDSLSKSKSLITPIDNQVSPKFLISKQSNYIFSTCSINEQLFILVKI